MQLLSNILRQKRGGLPTVHQRSVRLKIYSIFTETEDLPLGKVFDLIYGKREWWTSNLIQNLDTIKLKAYFEEILPEYDKNRVYISDMKKVTMWYNILQKLGQLIKDEPEISKG